MALDAYKINVCARGGTDSRDHCQVLGVLLLLQCWKKEKRKCCYHTIQNYGKLLLNPQIPCSHRPGCFQRNESSQLHELTNLYYFQKIVSDSCLPVSYESSSPWQSVAEFRSLETRESEKYRSQIFSPSKEGNTYKGMRLPREKQHSFLLRLLSIHILTIVPLQTKKQLKQCATV